MRRMWRRWKRMGIGPIDMVVVNLYAFEMTAAKPGVGLEDLIDKHRHWGAVDAAEWGKEL